MLILKKGVLSLFLILTVLFYTIGINITQVQAEEYNNLLYSVENDEITIIGIKGLVTEIEIPSEISGYPVTKIADDTFYQSDCHETLKKVKLPDTINSIGKYAFAKCDKLQSIKIPQKVVTLDDSTFSYCFSLKSLFIYNTLTSIGNYVFDVCPLEKIYYSGSEEEYNNISVASNNDSIKGASVFYNCTHMHEFSNYISDSNATCETNCTETAKCDQCDVVDTRDIPNTALGHNWDIWVVTKNATMTETGEKQRVCKNESSHVETATIPMLDSPFAGGNGTAEEPYQVSTLEQLNEVRNYLDKSFIQVNDIDMTAATAEGGIYWNDGNGWIPIGDSTSPFCGVYDGNNYNITGLYCQSDDAGLFGYAGNMVIRNVNLTVNVIGTKSRAAAVLAYCYPEGVVSNCISKGSIVSTLSGSIVGGIVAHGKGVAIDHCLNYASVRGTDYVGGIIGAANYNDTSNITQCYNAGDVEGDNYIGGIVGQWSGGQISFCGNVGIIITPRKSSYTAYIGGIVGEFSDSKSIVKYLDEGNVICCFNTGTVTANINPQGSASSSKYCAIGVGGIIGVGAGITIKDCFNMGRLKSLDVCGGIVGSGIAYEGWFKNTGGVTSDVTPNSKILKIINCYNLDSENKNNIYGYNASDYGGSTGYGGNSWSYVNRISVSVENVYNAKLDDNTDIKQLSKSEMQQKENFSGFDFDAVWDISREINNGYPYLRNVPMLSAPASFAGGSGTEDDPYQVSTPEQLNEVRKYWDKHFIQINDIDMTAATAEGGICWNDGDGWKPIGDKQVPFLGTYCGNGYAIKGLTIKGEIDYLYYMGLFGVSQGTLCDIWLAEGTINTKERKHVTPSRPIYFVGGIVGLNEGKILYCRNTSAILVGSKTCAGGIAGESTGEIIGCNNEGEITAACGGGIAAVAQNRIEKCCNSGKIVTKTAVGVAEAGYAFDGGIAGKFTDGVIKDCYSKGEFYVSSCNGLGYLCGRLQNASVENFYCATMIKYRSNDVVPEKDTTSKFNNTFLHIYIKKSDCNTAVSQYLSEDEMKQKECFVGFDFDTVWDISPRINNGMPFLRDVEHLQPVVELGDTNNDGNIDFRDAQLILQYAIGLITLTDEQQRIADVNGDGEVDFRDAQLVLQLEAGIITKF